MPSIFGEGRNHRLVSAAYSLARKRKGRSEETGF